MRKSPERKNELRAEYDLSNLKGGVRGKYYRRAVSGTKLVLIDPNVHQVFNSPKAVNQARRLVIELRKIR